MIIVRYGVRVLLKFRVCVRVSVWLTVRVRTC